MTASFTLYSKKHPSSSLALRACFAHFYGVAGWLAVVLLLWMGGAWPATAHAQQGTEVLDLQLQRTDTGLFLSTVLPFELPVLAEDALHKGIPLFFVMEAKVLRERWYWYPETIAETIRYMRLNYQPLTRRWRLAVSSAPINNSGLGVALGQNYDGLAEALAAMQRISYWKIANNINNTTNTTHTPTVLEPNLPLPSPSPLSLLPSSPYAVHLRFYLDMSQLPRPLQIGAMGRSGWSLSITYSQRLASEHIP